MNIHCRVLDKECQFFSVETCELHWPFCNYQAILKGKPDTVKNDDYHTSTMVNGVLRILKPKAPEELPEKVKVIPIEPDPMLPKNTKYCKCTVCGKYFSSESSFDKHRVGGWDNRRCLSEIEMDYLGMAKNKKGYWVGSEWPSESFLSSK